MAKNKYIEQGRVQSGDTTEVVVTQIADSEGNLKGFFCNNYVTTDEYTGPKKGVTINEQALSRVLSYFPQDYLEEALEIQKSRKN